MAANAYAFPATISRSPPKTTRKSMKKRPKQQRVHTRPKRSVDDQAVKIIGGKLRRSTLIYDGNPRTRPMKNRTREAVFNLLGPTVEGMHAIDLFAGTGALGLEAISRGASRATFIERRVPTAKSVQQNISMLAVEECCEVVVADTFFWVSQLNDLGTQPILLFCSPPYELYQKRSEEMINLLSNLMEFAPPHSTFVVEADNQFDFLQLPRASEWDVRKYAPAIVALLSI